MGIKNVELRAIDGGNESVVEKVPEAVEGLPPATSKISGFRRRTHRPTQYSEGPRTTERPLEGLRSDEKIEGGILQTQKNMETVMEPIIAKIRLRALGLDDYVGDEPMLDRKIFQELVTERSLYRQAIIAALHRNYRYKNEWWNSINPVERLWGQLNNGFVIIPKWQFVEDLSAVLQDKVLEAMPAGFADEVLMVLPANKEALKKKVYEKLIVDGFVDGDNKRVYTDADLDAIIAVNPEDEE